MKTVNALVGAAALVAAALSPFSASALVSTEATVAAPAAMLQQDAKLKPFWEQKGDFCILIIALCIEPDEKKSG